MRILFLCEGDAETHDSWSGVSRSVVTHLRKHGHTVITGDVDLYGRDRMLVAARTLTLDRKRWWVRYHLSRAGFQARSARAADHIRAAGDAVDVILQVGATFELPADTKPPVFLYCDSNILLAKRAHPHGYSEAAVLTAIEVDEIRRREAHVYAGADFIFTMSDMLRQSFIDDFDVAPDRLLTVHCAPNVPFPRLPEDGDENHGDPTVLFVGRDFDRKGGDVLIEAMGRVRELVPEARLKFVGCEARRSHPAWIEFAGFQSRDTKGGSEAMDRFYRTASVFCLPTRFEPFGTSFVEAMAYGLPCVGPDAWAVPEIIIEGETGRLARPADAESFAAALLPLLQKPDVARRMGKAGRIRAMQHFTWPGISRRMLEAISTRVTGLRPQGEFEART